MSDYFPVETLTINLNDEVARRAKESAGREHKSISEWIEGRITSEVNRAGVLATLESRALANGYSRVFVGQSLGEIKTSILGATL